MARNASSSDAPNCQSNPFAAADPVAVLAAVGAAEFAHQHGGLLGDRAHPLRAALRPVAPHVENRPHVQRAHRGMRVPGAVRAVPAEDLGERVGVVGQVLERNGAVLDEAHRFAVAFEAHHDVEGGLAHLPDLLLGDRVGHLDHASGRAEIAHQGD